MDSEKPRRPDLKRIPMPEHEVHKTWYHDPGQVEALVDLLEVKKQRPQEKERDKAKTTEKPPVEELKFTTGTSYDILFPHVESDWENMYPNSPKTPGSFASIVSKLASGKKKFGPEIPEKLKDRFYSIMNERGLRGAYSELDARSRFWTVDKVIIAGGLSQYCSLSYREINKFFEQKFDYKSTGPTIRVILGNLRRQKAAPFHRSETLTLSGEHMTAFVEELRLLTGMSLQDLRDWIVNNATPVDAPYSQTGLSLKKFDSFVAAYQENLKQHQERTPNS